MKPRKETYDYKPEYKESDYPHVSDCYRHDDPKHPKAPNGSVVRTPQGFMTASKYNKQNNQS